MIDSISFLDLLAFICISWKVCPLNYCCFLSHFLSSIYYSMIQSVSIILFNYLFCLSSSGQWSSTSSGNFGLSFLATAGRQLSSWTFSATSRWRLASTRRGFRPASKRPSASWSLRISFLRVIPTQTSTDVLLSSSSSMDTSKIFLWVKVRFKFWFIKRIQFANGFSFKLSIRLVSIRLRPIRLRPIRLLPIRLLPIWLMPIWLMPIWLMQVRLISIRKNQRYCYLFLKLFHLHLSSETFSETFKLFFTFQPGKRPMPGVQQPGSPLLFPQVVDPEGGHEVHHHYPDRQTLRKSLHLQNLTQVWQLFLKFPITNV